MAEVLITLGIIGVILALLMPTLIQNHKKKQTISQLKAAYSTLSQATSSAKIEHGDISIWDFGLNNIDFANKYVLPYLKIVKTVSTTQDKSYWKLYSLENSIFTNWPWDNGNDINENPIYILSNGSAITISHFLDLSMRITVDINGPKGPNVMGIDGFCFHFNKNANQLMPEFWNTYDRDTMLDSNNGYACSRETKGSPYSAGTQCAAVIMIDGWQISKDYPWGNGGRTPTSKD